MAKLWHVWGRVEKTVEAESMLFTDGWVLFYDASENVCEAHSASAVDFVQYVCEDESE